MTEEEAGGSSVQDRPAFPVWVRHLTTVLVWGLVVTVSLWFFSAVKVVLLGVLAAAAVACALWPIMKSMHRSRGLSALVVGVGFIAVAAALVAIISVLLAKPIREEIQQLPQARQQLDVTLGQFSERFNVSPPLDTSSLLQQVRQWFGQASNIATTMGQTLVSIGVALAFIFIGSIYFLAEPRDKLLGPILPALPLRRQRQLLAAMDELGPKLRWWLIGVLISMTVVGIVSGIGYTIAGINFALPLAVMAGFAELVPTIGPLFAGVIAVLVGTTQGSTQVFGAIVVWAVVQTLESYVILPLVMRKAVHMPAVVTLFTVVLWGEVFGVVGLFMAIPMNLLVYTMFRQFVIDPDSQDDDDDDREQQRRKPATPRGVDVDREAAIASAHPT